MAGVKKALTIRSKLVLFTTGLILLVGGGISWFAAKVLRDELIVYFEANTLQVEEGVSAALVDALYFQDVIQMRVVLKQALENRNVIRALVLDSAGRVLSDGSSDNPHWLQQPSDTLIRQMVTNERSVHVTQSRKIVDGHPIYSPDGGLLGFFYLEYSTADLEQALAETLQRTLLLTFGFLLMGWLLAWLLAWRATKPLTQMLAAVREIGAGNLATRLPTDRSDEIGALGEGINAMARDLKRSHASNDRLDGEVKEREQLLADLAEQKFALDQHSIVTTTDVQGTITYVNDKFCEISGYSRDELLGQNHRILNSGYHDREFFQEMYRIIANGGVWHGEICNKAKDGHLYWVDSTIVPFKGADGKPQSYIAIRTDITERKRVEQMKSEFVATVSHELRTPLTSISGSLGLIVGGALGELPEQMQKMIAIAHSNSQRLSFLINDLLDMEKLVAGKMQFDMEAQPLMPLIEQSLEANRSYGSARRVVLRLGEKIPTAVVRVDHQRLLQVMSNLLSNAIKYSPEDGTVDINVTAHDNSVRVTVRDHGPGIPVAFRSRIFQKFSQADSSDTRQKGGTGLGLAICKELMERMGGEIGFDLKVVDGASFYFELPRVSGATATAAE